VFTRRFAIPSEKRAGSGLVIEPASTWGNPINPVTLSKFSAQSVPGRTWLPEVNAEARAHALTIPRFRKDLPPRHVLLAANGDVLRGEIEAVTPAHFSFRSGLETLRVPRDRVKAAIWLKKADQTAAVGAAKDSVPSQLERKISRHINYSNATLSTLVAYLQREVPDVKFKVPNKLGERRVSTQFGEQTIGEALEQICTLFELRHRFESENTIVLEPASVNAFEQLQKVYWLGQSTLPKDSSVEDFLASKGILLPAGTSVHWLPESRQLSMTHNAVNHRKLQEVLDQLGGSLSPTHWLLLTNGARIGLAVEKFTADSIIGRHPQYGRCTVPVSQVYTIRTSMPPPTAAMKALEDWRLVFAPEPVLPETGGESSPALGKEAKPFKLPLLGGGDFDLAGEKGHVVVLDFWATWCGPCIKSLPTMIEALAAFPTDRVKLIGVNQSEPAEQVKRFIETRSWNLTVAMDSGQKVARDYGVDGIPHTVIVGPDGKVAWVKTGYHPDAAAEAANVIKQLLTPP
jgi:peroxiredoxin